MSGLPLFEARALARRDDPATSKAAAEEVGTLIGPHEQAILDALADLRRPAAAEEIALYLGWLDKVQVAKRFAGLIAHGRIERTGDIFINASGRKAARVRRT